MGTIRFTKRPDRYACDVTAVVNEQGTGAHPRRQLPVGGFVFGGAVLAIVVRDRLSLLVEGPAVQTWFTVSVSITIQAMPFLVLGVVLSGAIAAFVSPGALARWRGRCPDERSSLSPSLARLAWPARV